MRQIFLVEPDEWGYVLRVLECVQDIQAAAQDGSIRGATVRDSDAGKKLQQLLGNLLKAAAEPPEGLKNL